MSYVSITEIEKLIEELTKNKNLELKSDVMKKIKNLCRSSNENVSRTYYLLKTQLKKDHAEVRYIILLAVNELYMRSAEFRKLLDKEFLEFINLITETQPDQFLPPPKAVAKRLQLKAFHFVNEWHQKFGKKSKVLRFAHNYIKPFEQLFMSREQPTVLNENSHSQQQERLKAERVAKIKKEMNEMKDEIISIINQIENCFQLIFPLPSEMFSNSSEEQSTSLKHNENIHVAESESESHNVESLRHHGLYDMKTSLAIEIPKGSKILVEENEDTAPILENLNDLCRQMKGRYLPTVLKWLKAFTGGQNCDDELKQAIDLKQLIEAKISKFDELNIKPKLKEKDDGEKEVSDDDFEEVDEKEGYEPNTSFYYHRECGTSSAINKPSTSTSLSEVKKNIHWSLHHEEQDVLDPTCRASTLSLLSSKVENQDVHISLNTEKVKKNEERTKEAPDTATSVGDHKQKLLNIAPVIPYDIDLYHWEDKKLEQPIIVKYDDLDGFWKSKKDSDDENEILMKEAIASVRTRTIEFAGKFEPVKWSCRAPLPSGKLCPRRDRYKCPLHGKIVKRDETGKPVESENVTTLESQPSTSKAVPDWQDPELLRDIEGATGINLKMPEKGKRKKKKQLKKKEAVRTNIKAIKNTVYQRLYKKIKKSHKRSAKFFDDLDQKRFSDKFGHQWNYSMNT